MKGQDRVVAAAIVGLASLMLAPAVAASPVTPRVKTIATSSRAFDINDHGQVVGVHQSDRETRSFVWSAGTFVDLGTHFLPTSINNLGQIVGCVAATLSCGSPDSHGALWDHGTLTDLGDFLPRDINDSGEMIGIGHLGTTPAFLFRRATGRFIPITVPKGTAVARHLNNHATVVGYAYGTDESGCCTVSNGGFLWRPDGSSVDLGRDFDAVALNDHDRVVGCVPACDAVFQTAVWAHGQRHALHGVSGLPPTNSFSPVAINDRGKIAGIVGNARESDEPYFAAVWARGHLTQLAPPYSDTGGINDKGAIIGRLDDGAAVLWGT